MITLKHRRATAAILSAANPTLAAGEFAVESDTGRIKIGNGSTAWVSLAYFVPSASDISQGTLPDARLSSSVLLAASLAAARHQTTSVLDVVDRSRINTSVGPVSNATYWSFFTPPYSLTVSQITMACAGAASGVTLARMGIYTMDASGNGSLVARTASDTTLFTSANTAFTRSLDSSAGGYPATYTLNAGQRYASALCIAASNTGQISGASCLPVTAAVSPRVQGVRTGANDLLATQGSGQYNGSVSQVYWARLS